MLSEDVNKAISEWTEWAAQPSVQRYDIGLLKIWIQFERFLGDLFVAYAIGSPSDKGYIPPLNIKFKSEEQLNAFLREGPKQYVEYIDKIERLSNHIFAINPFDILLSDAEIKPAFEQMRYLRNYIAHESGTAKRKLINALFDGDDRRFVEPNEFLKTREKTTKNTYFTYYIDIIRNILELLVEPPES